MVKRKDKSPPLSYVLTIFALLILCWTGWVLFVSSFDDGPPAELGFFAGWRHGFLSIFVVLGNIFLGRDEAMYVSGTAGWSYDLGFLIGVGILAGVHRLIDRVWPDRPPKDSE